MGGGADLATTVQTRAGRWNPREDRKIYIVWLGIMWLGNIIGFGLDIPLNFVNEAPSPSWVTYAHGAIMTCWLLILSAQILLVQSNRVVLHRKLGIAALWFAVLVVISGLATPLTRGAQLLAVDATHLGSFSSLAFNFVGIIGFSGFTAAGYVFRRDPASHKRMMMLAMVAISNPGFGRIPPFLSDTAPSTFWPVLLTVCYGSFLLIGMMAGWDLWKRGTLNRPFAIGSVLLIASEFSGIALIFNPSWNQIAIEIIRAWGYAG